MLEIDISGSQDVIDALKKEIGRLAAEDVRTYRHGGLAGEAGVFGLLTSVLVPVLPKVIDLLKRFVSRDRNLKINIGGLEVVVRDIAEASELLRLLADRGLLPRRDEDAKHGE